MRFTSFREIFTKEAFTEMSTTLNVLLRRLSTNNFSGEVIEDIAIPTGIELAIPHNLKVVPKYRIILKNTGEFDIGDGDTPWTDRVIYLKNNGAADATVSILILRS